MKELMVLEQQEIGDLTTKLLRADETPPIANVLLGAGVLSVVALLSIVCSVLVRWLDSCFAFFCLAFALGKMQMY
jgi:hypothetical protein